VFISGVDPQEPCAHSPFFCYTRRVNNIARARERGALTSMHGRTSFRGPDRIEKCSFATFLNICPCEDARSSNNPCKEINKEHHQHQGRRGMAMRIVFSAGVSRNFKPCNSRVWADPPLRRVPVLTSRRGICGALGPSSEKKNL
jgi:hypothetical protein